METPNRTPVSTGCVRDATPAIPDSVLVFDEQPAASAAVADDSGVVGPATVPMPRYDDELPPTYQEAMAARNDACNKVVSSG